MSQKANLHRVYNNDGQLLFLECASSPVGRPLGVLIQAHSDGWEFFPSTAKGYGFTEMMGITAKLAELNEKTKHDNGPTNH